MKIGQQSIGVGDTPERENSFSLFVASNGGRKYFSFIQNQMKLH